MNNRIVLDFIMKKNSLSHNDIGSFPLWRQIASNFQKRKKKWNISQASYPLFVFFHPPSLVRLKKNSKTLEFTPSVEFTPIWNQMSVLSIQRVFCSRFLYFAFHTQSDINFYLIALFSHPPTICRFLLLFLTTQLIFVVLLLLLLVNLPTTISIFSLKKRSRFVLTTR